MNNQTIGVAGVFGLAFFLLALRYCILSLGRPRKSRYVNPTAPRASAELSVKAAEDDHGTLWPPDNEAGSPIPAGEAARTADAPQNKGRPQLRLTTHR